MPLIKELRSSIKQRRPSIGTWMQIPSPEVAEILSTKKSYDWIVIDMEHGTFGKSDITSIVRAISMNSVLPFVRLQTNKVQAAKDVVDCGFKGYIVPMVENIKQLKEIRNAILYPPEGKRGVGFSRSNQYGINFNNAIKDKEIPFLVAMIETIEGLKNIENILNYEYLDAILVGPYDLSASLGVCGEFESKTFKDAYETIKKLCIEKDVAFGVHIVHPSNEKLKETINDGSRFIAFSIDSVMLYSFEPSL